MANFSITRDLFLQFLDHLNRTAVASPPVQVLGLAGNIVGMVPLQTAQIVGGVVNVAATLTTVAMSKGRVEALLRQANNEVFGPRGLRVLICKLDAVAKLAGIPILNDQGKIDDRSSILAPFDDELQSLSVQHRRIVALEPWLSPLDLESLPTVERPETAFGRMHAAVSERQRTREEKKLADQRRKMHSDWTKDSQEAQDDYEKELRELARDEDKVRSKGGRRMDRDIERIESKRQKAKREYEKEMQKADKSRRKDDKEENIIRKVLFVVVQEVELGH